MLLTGGAGFIGTAVTARLRRLGHAVIRLDNLHPQVHPSRRIDDEDGFVLGDVTDSENWRALIDAGAPDVIVHLAAETGTGQSLTEATRHADVNVSGTTVMLDALHHAGRPPTHIVLASSRAVYGDGRWLSAENVPGYPRPRRIDDLENAMWLPRFDDGSVAHTPQPNRADLTEARPGNVYAATKLAQEHILSAWCNATGTALSILRLQNVYGPGQSLANPYTGILALFGRLAQARGTIDVFEDGKMVRDFVFIDDVADAIVAAVERPPTQSRLLDIGSGESTTVLEVASRLAELGGAPVPQVSGRYRPGDVRAASADIGPAMADLGWRPRWTLSEGLATLLDWVVTADGGAAR